MKGLAQLFKNKSDWCALNTCKGQWNFQSAEESISTTCTIFPSNISLLYTYIYIYIYIYIWYQVTWLKISSLNFLLCGPGSAVGIATGYGLDGPGSNPGVGEIFRTCPDRPWGPPSLLYNGHRVFPGGKGRPGRDADPSPPSSAVGHERIEL